MERNNAEFHIAEYSAIRTEMSSLIRWTYLLIMYGVIANAFIVAWITTQVIKPSDIAFLYIVTSWLPTVITMVSTAIALDNIASIRRLGDYCVTIEKQLASPGFGWQQYVREVRKNSSIRVQHIFFFVFSAQFILSIAFGLYMTIRL